MNKDKAEEKARAVEERNHRLSLIGKISVIKSNIEFIAESGKINGSLMLSIQKLMSNYSESLSTENAQLREALKNLIGRLDCLYSNLDFHNRQRKLEVEIMLSQANQLLTTKTQDDSDIIVCASNTGMYSAIVEEEQDWFVDYSSQCIDCRSNPSLFKALTAIRDDSDYMQWFGSHLFKELEFCEIDTFYAPSEYDFHKATLKELTEYFKVIEK